jgi:hypothetical protein
MRRYLLHVVLGCHHFWLEFFKGLYGNMSKMPYSQKLEVMKTNLYVHPY